MIMGGRAAEACPTRSEAETRDAVVTRILAATWGLLFVVAVEGYGKFREGLDSRARFGCKLGSGRRRDAVKTRQRKKKEHEKSKFGLSTNVRIRRGA